MDCPHCRATLAEGAATCGSCGVDLVKLKARELLAKLKTSKPAAPAEPPWAKSAMFLGALAVGACLLLYGATLVVGRSAEGRASSAVTSASALATVAEPAPAAEAPAPIEPRASAQAPQPGARSNIDWKGSPPLPPPPGAP